jgi:hypothetical protein
MVKIYGSYRGLFVFMLLDDYRVCVKKRNFYRPPSAAPSCDIRWCGTAHAGERRYITSEGGEGRPVLAEMSLRMKSTRSLLLMTIEEKNLSCLLQAFRRPSQYPLPNLQDLLTFLHGATIPKSI